MMKSIVLALATSASIVSAAWPEKCCLLNADDRDVQPITDCTKTESTTWSCPGKGTVEYHYNAKDAAKSAIKVTPFAQQNFFVRAFCANEQTGGEWSNVAFCPPAAATTSETRPFFNEFHGCETPYFRAVLYTGYEGCSA